MAGRKRHSAEDIDAVVPATAASWLVLSAVCGATPGDTGTVSAG